MFVTGYYSLLFFLHAVVAENTLDPVIRGYGSQEIFVVTDGQRHSIPDWETFLSLGYNGNEIKKMPEAQVEAIPLGSPLGSDTLIPYEIPPRPDPELSKRKSITKVVVPSVYKEWETSPPQWAANTGLQAEYNYSLFIYQKHHPHKPNYIARNRGTEAGVYLRYIVDHYHDFPDVAIFVHARPEDHSAAWLDYVKCISPSATYININLAAKKCRSPEMWGSPTAYWVEQCWRDILKIVWDVNDKEKEKVFNHRVPSTSPFEVCFVCCQQFLLSRETMRMRPLHVWKRLLEIIGEQEVCHHGEPEYDYLYAFRKHQIRPGPEPAKLPVWDEDVAEGYGAQTQGGAMEHLSHMVFGFNPPDMVFPDQETICSNFLPKSICPGSPCES